MASEYKLSKAEFGLWSYSIALPEVSEDVNMQEDPSAAHQVVKSRSFDLQPEEKKTGASLKQRLKGWLTRESPKKKTEKRERRVNDQPSTTHRESPLHKRSWLSGKSNSTPTEVEEVRAQGSPSLVKLSMKRKDSDIYQVTLRTNRRGLGMLYSAGLPPITVIFVERGGQAEDAGVKIGDTLLSVNGVDCFNPNLSISQLMEIKAMINQTNEKTVEPAGTQEPTKKEDMSIVRSTSVSNPLKSETEDKLSQASSDLEVTNIDSDSETATQIPGSPQKHKEKTNIQLHSGLLKAHTIESEPLILKVALEGMEHETSDEEADLLNTSNPKTPSISTKYGNNVTSKEVDLQYISKLKPTLGIKDGNSLTLFPSSAKEADFQDIPRLKPSPSPEDEKSTTQSFFSAEEVDLTTIPKLKPSLGLKDGHSRRDAVAKRQKKHRPATSRHSLLLDSAGAIWMGSTRIEVPTPTPVKLTIPEDSNSVCTSQTHAHQTRIQQSYILSEIHLSRADESENQAKIQQPIPKHHLPNTTHTENLNKGALTTSDFKSRSAETPPKAIKISTEQGKHVMPSNERLNPIPELRKKTSMEAASTNGVFPQVLDHRNLGSTQRKRQSLDAELYLTALTKESPMASAQQAGPGDGPAMRGPTNRHSTISSERTDTLKEHISGPAGNSTAPSNTTDKMKRARSYTICSTTALKDSKESKSASSPPKNNSPGSVEDLASTTSNQQYIKDSLLPKQGLVKARMAMFQKQ